MLLLSLFRKYLAFQGDAHVVGSWYKLNGPHKSKETGVSFFFLVRWLVFEQVQRNANRAVHLLANRFLLLSRALFVAALFHFCLIIVQ